MHIIWLLDDHARLHQNVSVKGLIEEKQICHWLQPLYSPNLSSCDCGSFFPIKRGLRDVQYTNFVELKASLNKEVDNGNRNGKYLIASKLPGI